MKRNPIAEHRAPSARGLKDRRGFFLAELLFAVAAIIIAAVWLLAAYNASLQLTEVSQQTSVALDDLKDMMEKVKATSFSQLNAIFPNGAADGVVGGGPNTYAPMVGGYSLANEQITVTHQPNVAADPQELVVQLTWTNFGRTYQRSVSTLRSSESS